MRRSLVELRLTGNPLSYVVEGQKPQQLEAVKAYRHFAELVRPPERNGPRGAASRHWPGIIKR